MTTARERAIAALHEALNYPMNTDVPRSESAVLVDNLIAACGEETWTAAHANATEQAIEQLTAAQLKHDEQIGKLIAAVWEILNGNKGGAAELMAQLEEVRRG